MRTRGQWFVGAIIFALGGCIIAYPPGEYDNDGATAAAASSSSSGEGGMSASVAASSSGGGSGGEPSCQTTFICDDRSPTGCDTDCPVHVASDRMGGPYDQLVRTVAVDSKGNFAIAGHYNQGSFYLATGVDTTKLPDSPAGNGAMFTEGFVGYYDASGLPIWAENIGTPITEMGTGRSVFAVDFDSQGALILVGSETPATGANANLFIRKKAPTTTAGIPDDAWTTTKIKRSIGGEITSSIAWDVSTDGQDFYVLGTSTANATTISCNNMPYTISTGPFVAKFNALGDCQWVNSFNTAVLNNQIATTAIYAKSANSQGVWITGTSDKDLPLAPLKADWNTNGITSGFVICLDASTGEPKSAIKLTGILRPEAISVVEGGSNPGDGTVVLSGGLSGITSLNKDTVNTTAAFVSVLSVKAPTSANTMIPGSFTHQTALFTSPNGSANATALVVRNDRIHIAGTFSDSLSIPPMGTEVIDRTGFLVPFIATLTRDTLTPLGVQAFTTESPNSAIEKNVAMAGGSGKLVLAGTWGKLMNLSTRHDPIAGNLPLVNGNGTAADPFFAQYSITP